MCKHLLLGPESSNQQERLARRMCGMMVLTSFSLLFLMIGWRHHNFTRWATMRKLIKENYFMGFLSKLPPSASKLSSKRKCHANRKPEERILCLNLSLETWKMRVYMAFDRLHSGVPMEKALSDLCGASLDHLYLGLGMRPSQPDCGLLSQPQAQLLQKVF